MLEQCVTIEGAASFSGFARPKTALQPETERSLTSEFGTGSGGSRALWPATEVSRFLGAYKRDGEIFLLAFHPILLSVLCCKEEKWGHHRGEEGCLWFWKALCLSLSFNF